MAHPRLPRPGTLDEVVVALAAALDAIEFGEAPVAVTAFSGAWVNFDGAPTPTNRYVRYFKDALGYVQLNGLPKDGAAGPIFTLPVGYRPVPSNVVFPCAWWDGAAVGLCAVSVNASTGVVNLDNVQFGGGPAAGRGPWLDAVRFRAA